MLQFSKKFVTASHEYSTFTKHVPAPLFRRAFSLKKAPDKAAIRIAGLGFYELFVNGVRLTKGLLAPYISNPDDIVYFDDYDLTPYLCEGENVIGVCLGNGMQNPFVYVWDFHEAKFLSAPKLAFYFEAETDGETVSFEADSCLVTESAILYDSLRSGVHYDASKAHDGWSEKGYNEEGWRAPYKAEMPRGVFKICHADPIKITEERSARSVRPCERTDLRPFHTNQEHFYDKGLKAVEKIPEKNGFLYDFGLNDAGTLRICIKGAKKGQRIDILTGERITDDGKFDHTTLSHFYPEYYAQRIIYYCRGGEEEEIFVPPFAFFGFRYAFVCGITEEQAVPSLLTYLVAHGDMKTRAAFTCSDQMANTLFDMTLRSDLSNFFFFPTDCPHREKNGWTGDASASAEHMMFTFAAERNYREWLTNIRAAQNSEGALPGIVPTAGWGFAWGNGPAWDSVIVNLPYYVYLFRGDKEIILENAHAIMRYFEYVSRRRDERGLVEFGLGDWVPTNGGPVLASLELTNGLMIMDICRKAAVMFDAVGLSLNKAYAEALGAEMKAALRREFVDTSRMAITDMCQTSQAMAIYYNLFEEGEKKHAFDVLLSLLRARGNQFDCGFLGLRVLFHVLAEYGQADLAYHLITKEEFPSYGYLVTQGETTLTEIIAPLKDSKPGATSSHNHHFLGDINQFFLRRVVGINPNPSECDPNEVLIRPHFISSLDFAEGWHETPAGKVFVRYEKTDENAYSLTVKADEGVRVRTVLRDGFVFADSHLTSKNGSYSGASVGKRQPMI